MDDRRIQRHSTIGVCEGLLVLSTSHDRVDMTFPALPTVPYSRVYEDPPISYPSFPSEDLSPPCSYVGAFGLAMPIHIVSKVRSPR